MKKNGEGKTNINAGQRALVPTAHLSMLSLILSWSQSKAPKHGQTNPTGHCFH